VQSTTFHATSTMTSPTSEPAPTTMPAPQPHECMVGGVSCLALVRAPRAVIEMV
jgi:hypothetical protein